MRGGKGAAEDDTWARCIKRIIGSYLVVHGNEVLAERGAMEGHPPVHHPIRDLWARMIQTRHVMSHTHDPSTFLRLTPGPPHLLQEVVLLDVLLVLLGQRELGGVTHGGGGVAGQMMGEGRALVDQLERQVAFLPLVAFFARGHQVVLGVGAHVVAEAQRVEAGRRTGMGSVRGYVRKRRRRSRRACDSNHDKLLPRTRSRSE